MFTDSTVAGTDQLWSQKFNKKWRLTMALESMGRRPLKCRYCQRSYKYKMSLKLHLNDAHRDKIQRRSLQNIHQYQYKPRAGFEFLMKNPTLHALQTAQIKSQSVPNFENITQIATPKLETPERTKEDFLTDKSKIDRRRSFSVIIRNPCA